jgi:hypothetical protein
MMLDHESSGMEPSVVKLVSEKVLLRLGGLESV